MTRSFIVVGLAYGDEGKGSWVDHLVRQHQVRYIVRFNGGVQANHNVVTSDGVSHGFAQLGAGSLVPGTHTLLSRFMLTDPEALLKEARILEQKGIQGALERVSISENAPVISPFNRLLNRIQEVSRGASRHGSCGMGIGLTQADVETLGERALYMRDLGSAAVFDKLQALHELKVAQAEQWRSPETAELIGLLENADLAHYADLYRYCFNRASVITDAALGRLLRTEDTIFEGAQGVLLDQQYGFFPHCTRSNCTFVNAEQLLAEANFTGAVTRIGLLRGYSTRHGAGPLVTETPELELPPCHNQQNLWQGKFRLGWFDAVSARYALKVVGGVDLLAITNLDRMDGLIQVKLATGYHLPDGKPLDERYFDEQGELRVLNGDVTKLGPRSDELNRVVPEYHNVDGWSSSEQAPLQNYLQTLELELNHPIRAYSQAIDHHKDYR